MKIIREETQFNKAQIVQDVKHLIGHLVDENKIPTLLEVLFFQEIKPAIFSHRLPFKSKWNKVYRQEQHISVSKELFEKCNIPIDLDCDENFYVEDLEVYSDTEIKPELDETVDLYIRTTLPNVTNFMDKFESELKIDFDTDESWKLWEYFERLEENLNNDFDYQFGGNCSSFIQNELDGFIALYKGGYGDCGILYVTKEYTTIQMY